MEDHNVGPIPEQAPESESTHAEGTTVEPSETEDSDFPQPRPPRRLNPPAYTPFPTGVTGGYNSPLFSEGPLALRRPLKGASYDSETSRDTSRNTSPTTVTPPGSGSGPALMAQMGIAPPGPAVVSDEERHPPRYGNNREADLRLVNDSGSS